MNIVDLFIIIFLLLGALVGWKQGFTKSLINCVGYIIIVVLAFVLKNPLSELLMSFLPFFDFWGAIKGVSVLNIALYEVLAFLIVGFILTIILRVLLTASGIFEKILNFTIILGIPSKILGAIVGIIKNYIIAFFILYILTLPNITGTEFINNSKYQKPILANTPILSIFADKTLLIIEDFADLKTKYQNSTNSNEFNLETLDLFLKYDVVKSKTVIKLVEKDKLHISGVNTVIEKYKED